jgi:endo-1,4-beta-mannosidase
MKKIWFVLAFILVSSPAFAANCNNIFEENFGTVKLMRVSSERTNFFNPALEMQSSAVVKNDLIIVANTMKEYSCSYQC